MAEPEGPGRRVRDVWRGAYRRISKGGLYSMVKRYAKAAGVEKAVTPHLFRHTA
jgi:site-specific recombinase XerD